MASSTESKSFLKEVIAFFVFVGFCALFALWFTGIGGWIPVILMGAAIVIGIFSLRWTAQRGAQ